MCMSDEELRRDKLSLKRAAALLWIMFCVLSLLSSCDPLLLAPSPRANWNDPDIAVTKFPADALGDDAVRVAWDWVDLSRVMDGQEPKVDKIAISHRRGGFPVSRIEGAQFHIDDHDPIENPMWSFTFEDLKNEKDHYFALHMHEKNGRWLAPLYAQVRLEHAEINSWNDIRSQGGEEIDLIAETSTDLVDGNTYSINDTVCTIFKFDVDDNKRNVRSAAISLQVTNSSGSDVILVFFSMRKQPDVLPFDFSVAKAYIVPVAFAGTITVDVSDLAARAFYHDTGVIGIITNGNILDIDYINSGGPPYSPDLDYETAYQY